MVTEDIRKLDEVEVAMVASLVERRDRLIREALAAINAQNAALTKLAKDWAGEEGTHRLDGRPDGEIYLVRVTEEPKPEEPKPEEPKPEESDSASA